MISQSLFISSPLSTALRAGCAIFRSFGVRALNDALGAHALRDLPGADAVRDPAVCFALIDGLRGVAAWAEFVGFFVVSGDAFVIGLLKLCAGTAGAAVDATALRTDDSGPAGRTNGSVPTWFGGISGLLLGAGFAGEGGKQNIAKQWS